MSYQSDIHMWLELNRTDGIRFLKRLIQERSLAGNESGAQAIVAEKCRELGLIIDIWEPSGMSFLSHPYFVSPRTNFSESPNLVATMKGTGGGRSLLLNGHIDVVPEGNLAQWDYDPYSGEVEDGKIYGRGATDMKGGNASLLLAIAAIKGCKLKLKGDVIFQSVIEEESGGCGTLAAILKGYKADGAIIPEPTNMKIFPKQQGSAWFRISIKGKSAHGGTRYEGVSAIEKSVAVIQHLLALEKQRNAQIIDPLYHAIPVPIPINIGKISGGTWPSSVPDLVVLEGRMGVSPNEKISDAKTEMEDWILQLEVIDSWFKFNPPKLEWFGAQWLPGEIDLRHDLMHSLVKQFQLVRKMEPIVEASPWGTDGGLLSEVGGIPTIVFGPGVTAVAHYPNEYIELDQVFEAAEVFALTMIDWCGIDSSV